MTTGAVTIDIFKGGRDGFGRYRIPALLKSTNGSLLAFCEGRKFHSDHAENKIVLRRSQDDGASWGNLEVVADAGQNSLNNPVTVQDKVSGAIILMYQEYPYTTQDAVDDPKQWISHAGQDFPPNVHEGAVLEGHTGTVCKTHIRRSFDEGETWSRPEEITRQVKRAKIVTSYAGGPGIGIQLSSDKFRNRLVMPFSQGPWHAMKVYAVFSDDGGRHWQMGNVAPAPNGDLANEVQIAELRNGDLLLNARSYKGNKLRKTAISRDGGLSWTPLSDAGDLREPECQGSMVAVRSNNMSTRLIYCGPNDAMRRQRGVLKQSTDGGLTWQYLADVHGGFFAYSGICELDPNRLGVLFECDEYKKISFNTVNIGPTDLQAERM